MIYSSTWKRSLRRGAVAGCAALGLALAACSSGSTSGGSAGGDYVVGYVNGMSGALAVYGEYTLSYLQAVVKQANASGGVNGRQVEIKVLDSGASGQNAVSATQQMITRYHPDVIYGNTLDSDCSAASAVTTKYKIPLVCASTAQSSVAPVQPYVFASQALEPQLAKPTVDFVKNTLKLKPHTTFAMFADTTGSAVQYLHNVAAAAKQDGYKQVADEIGSPTAASVATQASDIVAKKPGVLFMDAPGSQLVELVQAVQSAGLKMPIIDIYYSSGYDQLLKLADPQLYTVAQANWVTNQTASVSGVAQVQKILTAGGMKGVVAQNQQLGPQAILPALGIVQALKTCGSSCTSQKMVTALQKVQVSLNGFAQGYGWSASSHAPVNYVSIVSYDPSTKGTVTDATKMAVGSLTAGG